ncbi:MAG: serine hydrolase [Chitinophagaceae bacterium]|nr:serine hydrolase [Chitinophagaceae bacterium]
MRYLLLFLFAFTSLTVLAQKTDKKLEKQIREAISGFHGKMGVYVYDLKKNREVAINADEIYPTASIVKIPILIGIMHKIKDGELKFHQSMTYTDSLYYSEGDDMLSSFKSGEKIELGRVISLMMSYSDNCASLWLQGLSGGGAVINEYMSGLGLQSTRVNSRTPGRRGDWEVYGWGQTTPREITSLLKMIMDHKIIDRQFSEKMLRMMGRQYWDEEAISQLPPDVFVADKNGAVDASRSEIMFVNGKHPYILAIFSRENEDQSWEPNNEAWVKIRKVSSLLWNYFNPRSGYVPVARIE